MVEDRGERVQCPVNIPNDDPPSLRRCVFDHRVLSLLCG
jgi:hypothetical protein